MTGTGARPAVTQDMNSNIRPDNIFMDEAPRTILLAELLALRIDLKQTREDRSRLEKEIVSLNAEKTSLTRKLELGFQLEKKQLVEKREELMSPRQPNPAPRIGSSANEPNTDHVQFGTHGKVIIEGMILVEALAKLKSYLS